VEEQNFKKNNANSCVMLKYFKKKVSSKENYAISIIVFLLILLGLNGDYWQYFSVDACDRGLWPNLFPKYSYWCEKEFIVNKKLGVVAVIITLSTSLILVNRRKFSLLMIGFCACLMKVAYNILNYIVGLRGYDIMLSPLGFVDLLFAPNHVYLALLIYLSIIPIRKINTVESL
jgi:hypothetical protein